MSDQIFYDLPGAVTLPGNAATAKYLRVKNDADGEWAICGATEKSVAVAWGVTSAAAEYLAARMHGSGTTIMIASEAITAGDRVFAAASGKVAATGTVCEGVAVNAATADGDQIIVIPEASAPKTFVAFTHTADSDEATATEAEIDTGLGVELDWASVHVTDGTANRVIDVLSFGTGADAGKLTVGSAALADGDLIFGQAGYGARAL